MKEESPYYFCKRECTKAVPEQFHNCLKAGHYDIAFEITWKTLTPTAANPCKDNAVPENCPENQHSEYAGYNNRWLTIDNRLAISPFTVKSAIANGFANLMGGCYRVVDRTEAHETLKEGKYPYTGKYKRYRVALNKSKPGILKSIDMETGKVVIQPVIEFLYDKNNPPNTIRKFVKKLNREVTYTYFGKYRFGMNAQEEGKKHRYYSNKGKEIKGVIDPKNFCPLADLKRIVYMGCYKKEKNCKQWYDDLSLLKPGNWVYYETFIDPTNCEEKRVHFGQNFLFKAMFNHEDTVPESNRECKDMTDLCPRCRLFGMTDKKERDSQQETREAIGYKGRFKASALINSLTLTEKECTGTVPYLQEKEGIDYEVKLKEWTHKNKVIARQFFLPIMGQPKPNKRDVDGYFCKETGEIKGAKVYKHSKTVSDNMPEHEAIQKSLNDLEIFIEDFDDKKDIEVSFKLTEQSLVKLRTKRIPENIITKLNSLKDRRFTKKNDFLEAIENKIREMPHDYISAILESVEEWKFKYSHQLRNYAQVCGAGLEFTGVVGAENCSLQEIAALLILLEPKCTKKINVRHGFKIGLGKAYGLGSVVSSIKKIWLRKSNGNENKAYEWIVLENLGDLKMLLSGSGECKELKELIQKIQNSYDRINVLECDEERTLKYPDPMNRVTKYWKEFWGK